MDTNEKYFVSLISSYLNNEEPITPENNIDWNKIYDLSAIHNVAAIVGNQILKIKDNCPDAEILSKFKQQIGYTLIDADEKENTINFARTFLCENNIDFIFVKGAILRNYYPIKEFRTGSDIDIVIRNENFCTCEQLLRDNNCKVVNQGTNVFTIYINNQHIEFHNVANYDNPYFKDIFDMCSKTNTNEYLINNENHLIYVLCHIIKHFNSCGAGIKMFMDIDAIIRKIKDFDYDGFMNICKEINMETFAKASLSLCHYWFSTPVRCELDFEENSEFIKLFETEIINGGNFGFNSRNLGNYYVNKGASNSGKVNLATKIRALFILTFPPKKEMKNNYTYLNKAPYLLPLAWISRICTGAFKRSSHSKGTIKSIMRTGKESEQYIKLLKELNI